MDEQIRHVELGPAVLTGVPQAVLGRHVTATLGTRRSGDHRTPDSAAGRERPSPSVASGRMAGVYERSPPTVGMTTGRALLLLGTIATLAFTAGILTVALLS